MKIYIATRLGKRRKVGELYKLFSEQGHRVVGKWAHHKLIKPYDKNKALSKKYSVGAVNALKECDVFILISDRAGTGMYIELGVAILSNIKFGRPKVFVVGGYLSRSMFYFHPSVNRRKTIEQVLNEIKEMGKK